MHRILTGEVIMKGKLIEVDGREGLKVELSGRLSYIKWTDDRPDKWLRDWDVKNHHKK